MAFMFPTVLLVLNGSSVAAVWVGGNRIGGGHMQLGALIAFLSYLVQILSAVMMATFVAVLWPRAAVCAERIQEVLDTDTSVVIAATPVTTLAGRGTLELRGVGFRYPGAEEPVLSDIDLVARPGQTTAIIGSTGAGKTTLLNLIPRLFDCTAGAVLVDGIDIRDLDPEVLWRRVGLVPQKPYLFSGTVASNLRFADEDATDEELWAALDIAQASDFVRAMPGGLDEPIAQGGTNVSGGQRQRLAIARALVRKPGIFLFDDSFSALDLATDARLRAALAPVTADATVVIVAQRVTTIIDADQILVLEDGRAVGLGTHRELLETCPTYAEIVASQLTARGGGVSADQQPKKSPAAEARSQFGGRMGAAGMPVEKSEDFEGSTLRLLAQLRPERISCWRWCCWRWSASCCPCSARRSWATPPTSSSPGCSHRRASTTRSSTTRCSSRPASTSGRPCSPSCSRTSWPAWCSAPCSACGPTVEDKINALPLAYVDSQPRGDLLSRVTNDIDNVAQSLQQTLSQMLTSTLTIVGVVVMMFVISPVLAPGRPGHHPGLAVHDQVHRLAVQDPVRGPVVATPATSTPRSRRRSPATRW